MGDITLTPGETRKIVSQPGPDQSYNIGVTGADVYLSHRKGLVREEGKRVRPGDRVEVANLEGKPLYAKNPSENTSNATLEVSEASFALFFQPRAVQATVQTSETDESAPATDDYTNATASGVDVSNGGTKNVAVTPPGRSDTLSLHVEGTAAFDVVVTWKNTAETYASTGDSVKEVLPVYYIDGDIDIDITDTSGGSNTVDYDITVV
jgi:hypothetical protein